jgi:hypothetical protein
MKSRILIILAALIIGPASLPANPVDYEQAKSTARNFFRQKLILYKTGRSLEEIKFENPFIYLQEGLSVFYAFNTEPGFIIISGDDAFTPVIGYSFEGSFNLKEAPAHVMGFIQNYIDQIQFIRDNDLEAEEKVAEDWAGLSSNDPVLAPGSEKERDVEPLLLCHWNQGSPYNDLCPEDPAGPGGHAYVGCVATAMAQIMYYWRYPEVGLGYNCYWSDWYGELCADFGSTYYQWGGMINGIDYYNTYPNAELQYHCAVSVDMNFTPYGSGAYSFMVPERLWMYWGYYNAEYLMKDEWSYEDWIDMLYEEIDAGHPVYYSGFNENYEGHAFVCDGYQGEDFHFNFGWGGSANGYYSLYYIYGFSEGQSIVRYFVPSDPAYPYLANGDMIFTGKSGSFTDGSGPVDDYINNQEASWLISPPITDDSIASITLSFFRFDLAEGDSLKVFDGATISDSLLGAYTGNEIPGMLNSTGHEMLVTFASDGSGTAAGFYAEFLVNSAVYCTGLTELTDPTGTISDGSGTYNYHNNSYCLWKIKPPFANTITLTFDQFDTEETADMLTIFDGSTKIGEFSGHEIPGQIVATSGNALLIWLTNENSNYQGWSVTYEVDNIGVGEDIAVHSFKAFPNPASDKLNVVFSADSDEIVKIRIASLAGEMIYSEETGGAAGQYHSVIDVAGFSDGIYILEFSSSSFRQMHKVAIQK